MLPSEPGAFGRILPEVNPEPTIFLSLGCMSAPEQVLINYHVFDAGIHRYCGNKI